MEDSIPWEAQRQVFPTEQAIINKKRSLSGSSFYLISQSSIFDFWIRQSYVIGRAQETGKVLQILLCPLLDGIERFLKILHGVRDAEANIAFSKLAKSSSR